MYICMIFLLICIVIQLLSRGMNLNVKNNFMDGGMTQNYVKKDTWGEIIMVLFYRINVVQFVITLSVDFETKICQRAKVLLKDKILIQFLISFLCFGAFEEFFKSFKLKLFEILILSRPSKYKSKGIMWL